MVSSRWDLGRFRRGFDWFRRARSDQTIIRNPCARACARARAALSDFFFTTTTARDKATRERYVLTTAACARGAPARAGTRLVDDRLRASRANTASQIPPKSTNIPPKNRSFGDRVRVRASAHAHLAVDGFLVIVVACVLIGRAVVAVEHAAVTEASAGCAAVVLLVVAAELVIALAVVAERRDAVGEVVLLRRRPLVVVDDRGSSPPNRPPRGQRRHRAVHV